MNPSAQQVDLDFEDLFFELSIDLLVVVGTDGYFKRVNPACERAFGYTQDELRARPLYTFLHPEDVGKTATRIQKLAAGTPTVESKNRYVCKDGRVKWFSWNTTPRGPLFYSVGRDITEQVQWEEKIRSSMRSSSTRTPSLSKRSRSA